MSERVTKGEIVVVSGLPRSGTSMLMKMLEAGGMEILADHLRVADEDNPKGYFEYEKIKQLKDDQSWIAVADGKAIKVISALLEYLPTSYTYKVIFMRRMLTEILASQKQMLIRRGEPVDDLSDEELGVLFQDHLSRIERWLSEQSHMDAIYIDYNEVVRTPATSVSRLTEFLSYRVDRDKMIAVIDSSLHRQRG